MDFGTRARFSNNKTTSFPRWLCLVRKTLLSLSEFDRKQFRVVKPFKKPLRLDPVAWKILYDDGFSPAGAVCEDLNIKPSKIPYNIF